jgi:hypothetical protein
MKVISRSTIRNLARLLVALAASVGLTATVGVGTAQAVTNVNVDASWQDFITGGGVGGSSIAGPYDFTSTSVVKVTVTDAFCHGDEFGVYDNGVLLGDTSPIAPEFHTCPFRLFFPAVARADDAILDPTFSQGTFYVAPGEHSLDFVNRVMWNDTATGTGAYFRLDSVDLVADDCKDDGWKDYGALFTNQGDCVSLVQHMLVRPAQ